MSPRRIATALATGRVLFGVGMFVAPGTAGRGWIGTDAERGGTQLVMRVAGIRDIALGVGSLLAMSSGQDAERWLEAGILADAGDATAAVLARGRAPALSVAATALIAGAAAGAGVYARLRLAEERDGVWA